MTSRLQIIIIFSVILWSTSTALAINSAEIYKESKGSVILLATVDAAGQPKSIGSGFYVGNGLRIATNLHVIEGAARVFIKTADGEAIEITQVAGIDAELDVAILISPQRINPLTLATTEPEIGDEILAIGNPQGLEATLSTGIVSGIRSDEGNQYYQITAPISPGSSGGPIISASGKVIGISSFYVSGGQNLNFAVPAAYIRRLLNKEAVTSIAAVSSTPSKPKSQVQEAGVRLVDVEIERWGRLVGYVQNLTQFPVRNVTISINYYKGESDTPENNRGYRICYNFRLSKARVHAKTAERFSCPLTDWQSDFRAVYQIIDYELVR